MTIAYSPAVNKPAVLRVLLGLGGPTGSGKTYSAMEIASGIAKGKPFAVLDTENGRALHYRADFNFDHAELSPPFRPERYTEAIRAAEGYPAIVIDSGSHEHNGDGGLLDWHEEELERMAGDDDAKRQRCAMAAWIKPKAAHKAFVQELLRSPMQAVIICFRAEEKTKPMKNEKGAMVPTNIGYQMITEKNLPFELTVALMMSDTVPGEYSLIKCTKHLLPLFDGRRITSAIGDGLMAWAKVGQPTGGAPGERDPVREREPGEDDDKPTEQPPPVSKSNLADAIKGAAEQQIGRARKMITEAKSIEDMTAIGSKIQSMGLPPDAIQQLRAMATQKIKELKNGHSA
jgi:hypothetical protein